MSNDFNPDWDVVAPMVEEQQRMALRIQELEARLQPLTEDEITLIIAECAARHEHTDYGFARAIERAHGIGGSDDPCNFRRIKWDASAPITLNDGRIGVGTFSELSAVKQGQVLQQLLNLLGPTAPACCGCAEEWQEAIDLIKKELE